MKRFQSNLTRVQTLCRQQSRLAQMEVARNLAIRDQAQRTLSAAVASLESAAASAAPALKRVSQISLIQGLQQQLAAAQEQVAAAEKHCQAAQHALDRAQATYQELHSKEERLSQLIEQQRTAYRREMRQQQHGLVQEAAVLRWTRPEQHASEVSRHD